MKYIITCLLAIAFCIGAYWLLVPKMFDITTHCRGDDIDCFVKKTEVMLERVEKLGGKKYQALVQRDKEYILQQMNKKGIVPKYQPEEIERLKKELQPIFWWAWFFEGEHILKCFWHDCVFQAMNEQRFSKAMPDLLKRYYLETNPSAPY